MTISNQHRRDIGLLALLVLGAIGASMLIGDGFIGPAAPEILIAIRLPRMLLAVLVGAALGLSGAALQGALRNGLADPGLLGVTPAAGLGAMIAFYWGISARFAPALPAGGLIGSSLGLLVLSRLSGRLPSGPSLILAGVALSALSGALMTFVLTLAPNPFALAEITFWLLGGLEDRTMGHVALAAPPILTGMILLLRLGPGLDALTLGEDTAATLGQPPARTLRVAALGCALAAGASAAVAGGIGFVGLAVPHLLRPWFGERPSDLLLPSALGGAMLLLLADMLARTAPLVLPLSGSPPLGALTALLGAPMLVRVVRRMGAP
jgi:iron complex transport system permease protein